MGINVYFEMLLESASQSSNSFDSSSYAIAKQKPSESSISSLV